MTAHNTQWIGLGILALALSACCTTPTPSSHAVSTGQVFPTPEQAVDAYIAALRNNDRPALLKILGSDADKLIYSGDEVADKAWHAKFVTAYDTAHQIESEGNDKDVLVIGTEQWPTPIPLVQTDEGWQWDTHAGEEEILDRRIGRNELMAIGVARAYVEAQREYATEHSFNGQHDYAQKFISSKNKHDGLYWPVRAGEAESPLGPLVAQARGEGYTQVGKHGAPHKSIPYHGYFYKILKQQGEAASGGAKSYIINGHMTGGFALLAYPAKYGDSGVMSFIINQNGIVYEKNMGPDTRQIARTIDSYNPDQFWKVSEATPTD